ncbi:hypothetical protein C0Q70_07424 [Pomacea canaliculata]|uniref:Uncharacterized protein n=1 Tax=Pomacea canaliculata TaxID=400727 RepID=A0A2T7PF08_POMCA|nr:hypothetical protein C0Q70_07424 [Pomacea canaliculata]
MGYGYPGVITQPPPTVNQTTVVVNQSPALYKPPRDWSTGICGCFDDIKVCLCVLCCEPCAEIKLSMDMGEHYCVPCCVPNWLVVLRTKLRTQHNIQAVGAVSDDEGGEHYEKSSTHRIRKSTVGLQLSFSQTQNVIVSMEAKEESTSKTKSKINIFGNYGCRPYRLQTLSS